MRFYQQPHAFYCGLDLHARTISLHILDADGRTAVAKTIAATPSAVLDALAPYRDGLVVGCECMFAWYWVADLCAAERIPFVLGHALYLKLIHGGKSKNDRIDAHKLATLLRGGAFPQAYVYPRGMRETRDLLRRRTFLVRQRSHFLAHLVNTNSQYNLPPLAQKLCYARNRAELDLPARFKDPSVRKSVEADLALVDALDEQVRDLELYLTRSAKVDDPQTYQRLRSVPSVGPVLALVFLYEIHDVKRFAEVGQFLSYARLVRCSHESAGKMKGSGGRRIGNAHLRWAFGEAACLLLRESEAAKKWLARKERKSGKARALAALAAKLGRAVYHLLRKGEAFDAKRFFAS
ncbi:MAG TPA: IS110 family transposase [Dehalococcoidia bacterium]|nr:IS110 family transposase [Dehalococcoidia bacterium]